MNKIEKDQSLLAIKFLQQRLTKESQTLPLEETKNIYNEIKRRSDKIWLEALSWDEYTRVLEATNFWYRNEVKAVERKLIKSGKNPELLRCLWIYMNNVMY